METPNSIPPPNYLWPNPHPELPCTIVIKGVEYALTPTGRTFAVVEPAAEQAAEAPTEETGK